ncbi:NAD(P) transhydrogenase subunit alpha [Membranihabitans marinus]|uniref:NAD(P) transhydrogenase subunit alpha n=1 Tax=Membranihabitans marinus TaxID=1227546 RepID=UPI001F22EFB7|nr:NAD(P) transhydrogenase subunit alpha [Membranihabitans marinus]
MKLGVLRTTDREILPMSKKVIGKLAGLGFEVLIERPEEVVQWELTLFGGTDYYVDKATILEQSDVLLSIGYQDVQTKAKYWLGEFQPFNFPEVEEKLKSLDLVAMSMDMIPRISRAQSMDVLSSMASIAGYKAVLEAANQLPQYFPMMITAAGSIRPAKVLVVGAGVAGLQAVATAKRLGAIIEAFDTRTAVKEEVESLGGKFVEVEGARDESSSGGYAVEQTEEYKQKQQEVLAKRAGDADVIITTAQLRGRPAPKIISQAIIESMKPGSVIVDLAASTGGNTVFTENNATVVKHGVTIIGNSNLSDTMPLTASELYANNVFNYLELIIKEQDIVLNMEDEIIKSATIS